MRNTTFLRFSFLTVLLTVLLTPRLFAQVNPYDIRPFNNKYAASHTEIPESLVPIDASYVGIYQWESSVRPIDGFSSISGATSATYTFSAPLAQTTYFRRRFRIGRGEWYYSNVIKMEVVSVNWEDINYVREHELTDPGYVNWKMVDQAPIGPKMQTTTYFDGLWRETQTVSREAATPLTGTSWGDVVKFDVFDNYGRKTDQYLPFTTIVQSGKFKTNALIEQTAYYNSKYNEPLASKKPLYENSPLNRVNSIKKAGTPWSTMASLSFEYELNEVDDDVRIFSVGYQTGSVPISEGNYAANTLSKYIQSDIDGNKMIIFTDKNGQEILSKFQISNNPSSAHDGWICTYSIYDEFGQLRYRIQPEGVKWLSENAWSFDGSNGSKVLDEQCFRYEYDAKKRLVLKKTPGASPVRILYDNRDRPVFTQDGNQHDKSPSEWEVNLYDDLDRPVLSALYYTSESDAQLQTRINSANGISTVSLGSPAGVINVFQSPLNNTEINNSVTTNILKVNYYDSYAFTGAQPFKTNFENASAYPSGGDPIESTPRTLSMSTGTVVRVLGSSTFLTSTNFYDNKGRAVQQIEENIKSGYDVTTKQYKWDGRILSSCVTHTAAGTPYSNFSIVSKNVFDKLGRIIGIEKKVGANSFVKVASYEYDDFSRLLTRRLAPDYTGTGSNELESLTYTYNIHSTITGINADYALKTSGIYSKWSHFFGLYLGYDNSDNQLSSGRLDGKVSGIIWNTQGDDAQRRFEYSYDRVGRLTNAVFNEKVSPSSEWNNVKMDFSSTGILGGMTYDLNGNLKSLQQKGVIPGTASPLLVDDLQYNYAEFSNKLLKVTDNSAATSTNGKLGDFKDGSNGSTDDYVYDSNGNLVVDLNKEIKNLFGSGSQGMRYNFLDKPEEIRIEGKGLVRIIYDANGRKLQREYTPQGSSATTTTSYIDQFVYLNNDLQYFHFEEGRVRVITPTSESNGLDFKTLDGTIDLPGGKRGVFDYYIKDYQSSVRMVLTIENHVGGNTCTMESARATNEEKIFGQIDAAGNPTAANEVAARFPTVSIPGAGWTDNTSDYVSRVGRLASSKVGPNSLMKVMAGDKISATTQYYYPAPVTNSTGTSVLSDLLGSLVQTIGGGGATGSITKEAAASIGTLLSANTPLAAATSPDANNVTGTAPKAYLTLLFFDERFSFVEESSQTIRVSQAGVGADPLTLLNIKAPKNGYAYIYISNESDEHVYFDNLQVSHNRGHILEENHYYSYGLKIAAISSSKLQDTNEGSVRNNYLYNEKEEFNEANLSWLDYGFRIFDPQIGRFTQSDPMSDTYFPFSQYLYAGNDPVTYIDYLGLGPETGLTAATATALPNIVIKSSVKAATTAGLRGLNIASLSLRVGVGAANVISNTNPNPSNDYLWSTLDNLRFNVALKRGGVNSWGFEFNKRKGFALEDAYASSTGMIKNVFSIPGGRIPDFIRPAFYWDIFNKGKGVANSIYFEVKAVQKLVFTPQIRSMIDGAANAHVFGTGYNASELGIAEFNLVTFKEHLTSDNAEFMKIKEYCIQKNVVFSTIYPEYNESTRQIRFSSPEQHNYPKVKGIALYIPFEKWFASWSTPTTLDFDRINSMGQINTNETGEY